MKRRIRLTEGDLRRIVNKSVRRVLKEDLDTPERELYRRIARLLTDYEQNGSEEQYDYTEEMYHLLTDIQNWMAEQGYDTFA